MLRGVGVGGRVWHGVFMSRDTSGGKEPLKQACPAAFDAVHAAALYWYAVCTVFGGFLLVGLGSPSGG